MDTKPIKIPSYITKQLLPDEYAIFRCKKSYIPLLTLLIIFSTIAIYGVMEYYKNPKPLTNENIMILVVSGILILVCLLVSVITYIRTELILTTKRVILRTPFGHSAFPFNIEYMNLEEISTVYSDSQEEFTPSGWASMIKIQSPNRFTVVIRSKQGITLTIPDIERLNYEKFKELLVIECLKYNNKIF